MLLYYRKWGLRASTKWTVPEFVPKVGILDQGFPGSRPPTSSLPPLRFDTRDFGLPSSHLPNCAVAVARYPDVRPVERNPVGNVDVSEFPDNSAIAAPHFHNQRKLRYPDVHSVKRDEPRLAINVEASQEFAIAGPQFIQCTMARLS